MWLRELCRERAQRQPDRSAFSFHAPDGSVAESLTYGELDRRAAALANLLVARTTTGARVVLAFEPGLDFVVASRVVYAGRVAVPIAAPRLRGAACDRMRTAWSNAQAELVLARRPRCSHGRCGTRSASPRRCVSNIDAIRAVPENLAATSCGAKSERQSPFYSTRWLDQQARGRGRHTRHAA